MLVHYRDVSGTESDLEQWDDRLWVFERAPEGDALHLTEFPFVAFDDERGRFASALGSDPVRQTGHWEPDAGQRREIERGLEASPRGARHRTLRRTATGWSSEAPVAYDSARFVAWSSVFRVDLTGEAPLFEVRDALGSSAARAIEGRTLYRGERVLEGGRVIEGAYDRDGRQLGTFRLTRSGVRRTADAPRPSAPGREEVYERFYRELGRQLRTHAALPERADAEEPRASLLDRVRAEVEALYRAQGNDPRPHAPAIERLSEEITRLYLDEALRRDEIGLRIQDGRLRP